MEPIRQPNWSALEDGYGSAADLPALLASIENPESSGWDELWQRVCHQGSTYSASPHVLPFLLHAASSWKPIGRVVPLTLGAAIVAAPETDLHNHTDCIKQLRELAVQTLPDPDLTRTDRIYVVQSVLAFEGDRLWGRAFDRLNEGEFLVDCPNCKASVSLIIGWDGFFCCTGDWGRDPSVTRTVVHPAVPDKLTDAGLQLHGLCTFSGDQELANWVLHLFGTMTCPECGKSLDVAGMVAASEGRG